ncbi:Abi family protein [Streptococcus agalactiae]|uniref:Abi family protein n=1 Tax=Streptococcus agalactiae TaxID=1311 RepID=UPI0002BA09E6|nr:Abi family protein [Streptococcus agalactiae]EPU63016.1 CAAX protease [Streptococcus agalactiae GB00082]
MKKIYQEPISIENQLKNLIDLGLLVEDKTYAKKILGRISYYRLIKAYSITLKKDGRYISGISFEDIVSLYKFDRELRQLIFEIIEHIEVSLRAVITNYFSLKYGNFGYKDLSNVGKYKNRYKEALNDLERETKRNRRSPFIKNFKDNYEGGEIPLYAVIEVASFGTLSKMYKNMKNEDKSKIAKVFHTDYHYFESWIENFAYIRNICAHYGRLYGAKLTKSPKLYKEYLKNNISNNTIFATLVNLKIVSEEENYKNFYHDLIALIARYENIELRHVGFIENWKELLKP